MPIREDIVASAISFLRDPNVASSPVENKITFLQSKNLTQEEIDAAFARTGTSTSVTASAASSQPTSSPAQQQPFYGQYQQPQPYGWQPPPPAPPKRDWRDWFIMATVMGGVGYGLYTITKRYITPLVSPPTPDRLDQDKALVDEQFEKAFATLEQLSKDTEDLKASEKERTEKLDKVLEELESFMRDTRSASRRHDDEADRLREEMRALKGVIPKSMAANKDFTDNRLKEITNEVKSLKSLINQRMTAASSPAPSPSANSYLRTISGNAAPAVTATAGVGSAGPTPGLDAVKENGDENTPQPAGRQDYISSLGSRTNPFVSGPTPPKASIPAWQLAASKDAAAAPSSAPATPSATASGSQPEAGSSS
ncbi:peroxisomal membrane anchor protein conserved region-domain-containing protein [Durotheca rogersii]|uniref:peroxisomal membrane anchor protein conserved region-domain-containing protein n=1 Tax=Durotheca rogersii TaxID=419775 RepID=UPI002221261D|nr:peroxisomal membrane anchor protein conserved region-domain-containing protein [Durotheca rogersii]KAI5866225.1 peroxisomal membrane anchor protein conserved region-domain-containing protein [Durotheca rogersii]